jgi:glycosyltransferase involved in cell wall biosynthesis
VKVLFFTDFDLRGSGYQVLSSGLASSLVSRGHQVVVLGLDYKGDQHDYPFAVVSTDPNRAAAQIKRIIDEWHPDVLCVPLDLTWQVKATEFADAKGPTYVGIFAVEGAPVLNPSPWAAAIKKMHVAFAISQFGTDACHEAGLEGVEHLRVGVDSFWQPPVISERVKLRKTLGIADKFVVITVSDNQERKNLPAAIEAIHLLRAQQVDAFWILVTKKRPQHIGWNLWALIREHKLDRSVYLLEDGCERDKLRQFYGIADAFLLTSRAEGLCLPVLEAMACGVPCVVPQTCELPALVENRGIAVPMEYWFTDTFGNSRRGFVSAQGCADALKMMSDGAEVRYELRERCIEYAQGRTWEKAAVQFEEKVGSASGRTDLDRDRDPGLRTAAAAGAGGFVCA